MKKFLWIVCTSTLMVSLTACSTKFDGSRTGNDSEFIMEYSVLNTTDRQDLIAESGDTISGKMIVNKGSLSIKIKKDGEEPVYESSISASDEFAVEIDESGTYTVEVTGKGAKGSVSFTVESDDAQSEDTAGTADIIETEDTAETEDIAEAEDIPEAEDIAEAEDTIETAVALSEYYQEEYSNPIDAYFLPRIENASCEAERRQMQDTYRGVWKTEFENVMAWMQDKCVYQEDKDNLLLFEESVDSLIETTYTVWMVTDYELPPSSDGRKSWGNGTRSAWNQKEGEIYRDVSMKLAGDTYIFMERDYSLELYE